jgi:hypothetical protein
MANGTNQPMGLLADGLLGNPLFNLGVGLLSASGPSPQPVSLGQALGSAVQFAGQQQSRASQNQALREQMTQQARQRQAREQLFEQLQGGTANAQLPQLPAPFGATTSAAQALPGGEQPTGLLGQPQQNQLGLLAQAFPEQFGQAAIGQLFPQQRADTSLVRNLQAAGIDPMSAEGQEIIRQNLTGGQQSEQLDQILKGLQIQQIQTQREEAATTKERETADARLSVFNTFDALNEIVTINDRLEGTIGETGAGFDEIRRAASGPLSVLIGLLGGDERKARQVAADFNRMEQLTTNNAINSLFGDQVGGGTLTNQKLDTFLQTKPGISRPPDTNRRILADMLESNLQSADKLKINLSNREAIEARIKQLRGEDPPQRRQERRESGRRNQRPEKSPPVDLGNGMTLEFVD